MMKHLDQNLSRYFLQASFAFLALIGLSFQAQAEIANCTNIPSVPHKITNSGIYCLNADVTYIDKVANAITIAADDVTIDLNGHALLGIPNNGDTFGTNATGIISVNRKNITIRNGTIRGFSRGVNIKDNSSADDTYGGHLLEDLLLDSNTFKGIEIQGPGNTIQNNRFINTGGSTNSDYTAAIEPYGPNVRVIDNDISGSTSLSFNVIDIYAFFASGSVFQNNRVTGASGGNSEYGIYVDSGDQVLLKNNFVSVSDGSAGTIAIRGSDATTVTCQDNTTINFGTDISGCFDGGGNVAL